MSVFAQQAASAYRQTEVQSRTPLELVVMLYDGALRFIAQAKDAIERRDIPGRRDAVSRAIAIISELQSTLDLEQGGDVAASLDRLYAYVNTRLIDASFKQDPRPLDEASRLLATLREAWGDIARSTAPAAPGRGAR